MDVNYGSISGQVVEYGYTGTYTGGGVTYPYVLTSHGAADPNSIMANANFATTGTVDLAVITDFDSAKVVLDWQAISDGQLWRQDVNTLAAVNVISTTDTTTTATLGWRVPDGTTGQFDVILQINATGTVTVTPASIQSVSVPVSGVYAPGDALTFTPNWSASVNVTGVPAINLTIGGQPRQANYASGTGTTATAFTYTVQSGDEGGISVSSLSLDGGTIKNTDGTDANLTLNSVGDVSGVTVDGVGPSITVTPLTTTNTAPIVSGSAGDASSLTLVVNGVTYNPVPSGGVWSQQLPTLAINDYLMTLDGTDAQGNAAIQRQAFLKIVSDLNPPGITRKLTRILIRSLAGKSLRRTL